LPRLQTARLLIVPFGLELLRAAMRGAPELSRAVGLPVAPGFPNPDLVQALPYQARSVERTPELAEWSGLMIHAAEQAVFGSLAFKDLPDRTGTVEIGYGIAEGYWGQGYTTEAARAMAEWAFLERGVRRVIAECLESNQGSIRVLEKLGMRRLPARGSMLNWELRAEDWSAGRVTRM
jgi:ribosomal-protein-alanine N-acetyltransferase